MITATVLAKRVWYRTLAKLQNVYPRGTSPAARSGRPCSAPMLPLELVEMIIAYIIYDTRSLRACTRICRSWYIAAAPHLHHNLFIDNSWAPKFHWPNPLQKKHALGLLPFVKTLLVHCSGGSAFSPKLFSGRTLRQFSALTNVRRLMIDHLDIHSFMPSIRQHFGHFPPTVRELSLTDPIGSRRQMIYFIGLFEHLEDFSLVYIESATQPEPADDLTLIPPFAPPLQGCLKLTCFRRVGLLKDMVDLFGGLHFYRMDLFDVDGIPFLLDACANTLRILRLYPTDPHSERFSLEGVHTPTNDSTVTSSLHDFDLSRNKSLQVLQLGAWDMGRSSGVGSPDTTSSFLKYVLSTTTSPGSFQIVVVYRWSDFHGTESWEHPDRPPLRDISQAERAEEVSRHRRLFEVFRGVYKVRSFWLQLDAYVWDPVGEYCVGILKEAVAEEKAKRGFVEFYSEPFVTYRPARSRL